MRNDVTRYPFGVTNAAQSEPMGQLGFLDPTKYYVFFDDFDRYTAADWVVTETQAGATQAVAEGIGGWLALTNSAADDDLNAIQWAGGAGAVLENFILASNKRLIIESRMKVSNATESDIAIGLYIADTTPIASVPADGAYLLKADGGTSFVGRVGKTSSYAVSSSFGTVADDTFFNIAMVYEGMPRFDPVSGVTYTDFQCYFNGAQAGTVQAILSSQLPTANLAVSVALQNGNAVARTLTVDRLFFALER